MAEKTVTIRIVGDASSASKAFAEAEVSAGGFESSIGKVASTAAGFALGGAISAAPGYLLDAAKAAADDSASMTQLQTAITNVAGSYAPYNDAIQQAITNGQNLGFSDDETRGALTRLTEQTGSADTALRVLSTAQDLARGTGISLEEAANLLGKSTEGNTKRLETYGVQVAKGSDAQTILNAVDAKFQGQAGAFAETDAAKMAIMSDKVGELQEQIGYYLIPVLSLVVGWGIQMADVFATRIVPAITTVIDAVTPLAQFLANNLLPVMIALAPILTLVAVTIAGALVSAFTAWVAATYAQVAAFVILNAAMLPWIAAALLVGAAALGLYLAWQNNLFGIRDITMQVIGFVRPYLETALAAILTAFTVVWPIITATVTGALSAIEAIFSAVWPVITATVTTAIAVLQAVIPPVFDFISMVISNWANNAMVVIDAVWPIIAAVVTLYVNILRAEIETALAVIEAVWGAVWPVISAVIDAVWPVIAAVVTTYMEVIRAVIEAALSVIQAVWGAVWPVMQAVIETVWNAISAVVSGLLTAIVQLITGDLSGLRETWDAAWSGMASAVSGAVDLIRGYVDGLLGGLDAAFNTISGWVDKVGGVLGKVDIPFHSPPGEAGYEIGQEYGMSLAGGIGDSLPHISRAVASIGGSMALSGGAGGNRHGGGMGALSHADIVAALREGGRQAARELLTGAL